MRFCPNCGAQTDNQRFCTQCGFPCDEAAQQTQQQTAQHDYQQNTQQAYQQPPYQQPYTQAPGQPPYGIPQTQSPKSRLVALLLAVFVGHLGVHHFYVGNTGKGIAYIFTFGLFGIGIIIDIIQLALGNFTDSDGLPVLDWQM